MNIRNQFLPYGFQVFSAQGAFPNSPSAWNITLSSSSLLDSVTTVVFGRSMFLLQASVASATVIASSIMGISWTTLGPGVSGATSGLLYIGPPNNGYFVFLSSIGGYDTSPDGANWSYNALGGLNVIQSLDWIPEKRAYIASATNGNVFTTQLITQQWQPFGSLPGVQQGATNIHYAGGTYVAVNVRTNGIFTSQ